MQHVRRHVYITLAQKVGGKNPYNPRKYFLCSINWNEIESLCLVRGLTTNIVTRYYHPMIKSFVDKETPKVFKGEFSRKLPHDIHKIARRKLIYIDEADELQDLRVVPGHKLETLRGKRAGQYSIRINDQWRICFKWRKPHAHEVEIVDYH